MAVLARICITWASVSITFPNSPAAGPRGSPGPEEARQHNAVKRVLARWLRYDVIVLDEVGYVPLADSGAEFLFQVIAERAERAALIVTTNLPFSTWPVLK